MKALTAYSEEETHMRQLFGSVNNYGKINCDFPTFSKLYLPLTTKRLQDDFWSHIDLEEVDSTVLVEQLKVVSKIRITDPYRKKGQLVTISQNDWDKINLQLESLYRLRPLKDE